MIVNTLMFRLKGMSTKSRVQCRDKKGSKRNYTWVMFALTPFGPLTQRSALRKAHVYPFLHWQIQIFEYMEDLLIQTLIFVSPAGFSLN